MNKTGADTSYLGVESALQSSTEKTRTHTGISATKDAHTISISSSSSSWYLSLSQLQAKPVE